MAFVAMPFGLVNSPMLGPSILAALVRESGAESKVFYYPNLMYAARHGLRLYEWIARHGGMSVLVGEWIFASSLFPNHNKHLDDAFEQQIVRAAQSAGVALRDVLELRDNTQDFLHDTARTILDWSPSAVGFSSLFQQQTPSLSLASLLRGQSDDVRLVLGGASCQGIIGVGLPSSRVMRDPPTSRTPRPQPLERPMG